MKKNKRIISICTYVGRVKSKENENEKKKERRKFICE